VKLDCGHRHIRVVRDRKVRDAHKDNGITNTNLGSLVQGGYRVIVL